MPSSTCDMAETEELKQMVLSFRRAELVELLGFAGLNKMGVKATLLQRAISLIQSQRGLSVPLQIKIRELYRQIFSNDRRRFPGKTLSPPQAHTAATTAVTNTGPVDFSRHPETNHSGQPNGIPVHPDVRFKRLPFYDILGELLKPTSLVPRSNSRFQETYFVFHLTPQQAQDIAMSRDFRPGAKCEYTIQIQLRFCLLETSCEQDDNFPPSICVRVNGKMAPLPNPIPTNKPGVEPKRPGRPVDITSLCRISPTMPNHVEISWASEYVRGYCVCVNLVKRLTSDILLSRLKQFGQRHPDHTRALIKEKLTHDPDSEVATTSLRVSLMCPLGKMRIQIPCRAGTCSHLQTFDAMTFLMMNEKKPTWMCPVCDRPAPFHKLIIDGLFVEICRQETEANEIQFTDDGSWSPLRQSKESHLISSPSRSSSSAAAAADVVDCSGSPNKKPKMEVIDLTVSSDEEEDEAPSSSRPISNGSICVQSVTPPSLPPPPHLLLMSLPQPPNCYMPTSFTSSKPNISSISSIVGSSSTLSQPVQQHQGSIPYTSMRLGTSSTLAPPAHCNNTIPPAPTLSRPAMPHMPPLPTAPPGLIPSLPIVPMSQMPSGALTRSSTNKSPLVDLDKLCSLLDTDRNSEEISEILGLTDFPMTSSNAGSRMFTISPSDVIALD
ncbi:hypothetical protein ACJMK2_044379 [Sinanodonta woodiana]|uniref:Uncharacterized protein n=1 Tax=Sinanodonta woodiana TaxID=1069815 RepID=A0ABD3VZW0_SINWO